MSAVQTAPENARDPLAALRALDERWLSALLDDDVWLLASLRAEWRQRVHGDTGPCLAEPARLRTR
jgi:hypothetical protein